MPNASDVFFCLTGWQHCPMRDTAEAGQPQTAGRVPMLPPMQQLAGPRSIFQTKRSVDRGSSECFQKINVLEQELVFPWCGLDLRYVFIIATAHTIPLVLFPLIFAIAFPSRRSRCLFVQNQVPKPPGLPSHPFGPLTCNCGRETGTWSSRPYFEAHLVANIQPWT